MVLVAPPRCLDYAPCSVGLDVDSDSDGTAAGSSPPDEETEAQFLARYAAEARRLAGAGDVDPEVTEEVTESGLVKPTAEDFRTILEAEPELFAVKVRAVYYMDGAYNFGCGDSAGWTSRRSGDEAAGRSRKRGWHSPSWGSSR